MVFIQAALSDRGPAATIRNLLEVNVFTLFVSVKILDEVQDVLSRPKIWASNLTFAQNNSYILL